MKRLFPVFALFLICIFALAACLPGFSNPQNPPVAPTADLTQQAIAVEKTVAIRQTIAVLDTLIARGTQQANPTEGPKAATPTPGATLVNTATPIQATLKPSSTPIPTATLVPTLAPTATPLPTITQSVPCNAVTFVKDITFPDNSVVAPGQSLTKIWRLKNSGSCTWNSSYAIVFASGHKMNGPDVIELNVTVYPGETMDLSIDLVAPTTSGDYAGYWRMRGPDNVTFGTNPNKEPFWVKLKVAPTSLSGTSFIDNLCAAVWKNNANNIACPTSKQDFTNGSVYQVNNPKLEGGSTDDEPALVMIPADGTNGMVSGRFPAIALQSGDHFISLLGCMDASPKCNVIFTLSYTTDGTTIYSLKSWDHSYGEGFVRVDIDLSSLAGKSVQFIFTVVNKDSHSVDDRAFWLRPNIKR
jgi:hypothetical protein